MFDSLKVHTSKALEDKNYFLLDLLENAILVPSDGESISSVTDNQIIIYEDFFDRDIETQYFILMHESLHIYFDHKNQSKLHNIKNLFVLNVAQDIIINEKIASWGYKIPDTILKRERFNLDGKNSIELYYQLLKYFGKNENDKVDLYGNQVLDFNNIPYLEVYPNLNTQRHIFYYNEEEKYIDLLERIDRILLKKQLSAYKGLDLRVSNEFVITRESTNEKEDYFASKILDNWEIEILKYCGKLSNRVNIQNYSRPARKFIKGVMLKSSYKEITLPRVCIYIDVSSSMKDKPMDILFKLRRMYPLLVKLKADFFTFNANILKIDLFKSLNFGGDTNINNVLNKINEDNKYNLNIIISDCLDNYNIKGVNKNTLFITNNIDVTKVENANHYVRLVYSSF
jgi:predicted metal-dependent peptidase